MSVSAPSLMRRPLRLGGLVAAILACVFLALGAGLATAQQMRASPTFVFLKGETGSRATLQVTSDTEEGLFVDGQLLERDAQGVLEPVASSEWEQSLALVPPQVILNKGQSRSIFLQWQGPVLREGKVFVLFFDQIDPRLKEGGVALQVSLGTIIVINPPGEVPVQDSVSLEKRTGGFDVINQSNHVLVIGRGRVLGFGKNGETCQLLSNDLLQSDSDTYVYPNNSRRFLSNHPCVLQSETLSWQSL